MTERSTQTLSDSFPSADEPLQKDDAELALTREKCSATASAFIQTKGVAIASRTGRTRAPDIENVESYKTFRRLADALVEEISKIDTYMDGESVTDDGAEVV